MLEMKECADNERPTTGNCPTSGGQLWANGDTAKELEIKILRRRTTTQMDEIQHFTDWKVSERLNQFVSNAGSSRLNYITSRSYSCLMPMM